MQKRKYSDIDKVISSILVTFPSSVPLHQFLKVYKDMIGEWLPSKALGYSSDVEFLESMPSVVTVCSDSSGKISLIGIPDEKSEHIQRLVSKQKKPPPKSSKKNFSNPRMSNSCSVKNRPFLPGPLRAEIVNLMDVYYKGIPFSAFVIAYRKKYNKSLPLTKGLDSLEDLINLIPELEVKTVRNERHIYYANCINGNILQSQQAKDMACNKVLRPTTTIHSSGISEDVLQIFKAILQRFPNGIKDVHFPSAYKLVTLKEFDIFEFGYNSLLTLVDALPEIFKRVKHPKERYNWIIYPAEADVEHSSEGESSTSSSSTMQTSSRKVLEEIPDDAASPKLLFIQSKILEILDLNDYIPIYVSSIINLSMFWFRVLTPDAKEEFDTFESKMGDFYDTYGDKYRMRDIDIKIGSTCIVYNSGLWYRSFIKAVPTLKLVNVAFVDYGGVGNVPRSNFYYVRSEFHNYPAYAFKAQLGSLKPAKNELSWSPKAIKRFTELCNCLSLMTHIYPADQDTFSIYPCNTSGNSDIHIIDVLMNEGFAEFLETQSDVDDISLPNDCKEPISNGITSESECSLESPKQSQSDQINSLSESEQLHVEKVVSSPECSLESPKQSQCNQISSVSESKELHVEKKVVSSPKQQVNDDAESNLSQDLKGQVSKRCIKLLQLCEDYKIHVINVTKNLFTTSGDVARLIWSDKDSETLMDRLKEKEIKVPFVKVSKKNYVSIFKQCIWCKIPEYEKLESSTSSLILFSLHSAFNILNIFGHPSACLRLAIQNEIKNFDPCDPIWEEEFNYDESHDLSDIEKEIEQQLSKLCLYDLKKKRIDLWNKRLLLQRSKKASNTPEIERINDVLKVLNRKVKQIESICLQYQSCV